MPLRKLTKFFLFSILLLTKSDYITKSTKYINLAYYKDITPVVSDDIILMIPKIKLEVKTSYLSTLKEGLEIHKLSTRPSETNSTLIIMGHAGIGHNVYFNNLKKIEKNDLITIDYSNIQYNYIVISKEMIIKGNIYNFEFNSDNLYLITCYHHDKQIIIKAKMAKN